MGLGDEGALTHPSPLPPREKGGVSASVAVAGVDIPVEANGIDDRARPATDETEDGVGVQGDSVETCA